MKDHIETFILKKTSKFEKKCRPDGISVKPQEIAKMYTL